MVDAAVAHGGGLQALINNAANMYRGPIDALDADKVLELFNVNVVSGMMLTRPCSTASGKIRRSGDLHRLGAHAARLSRRLALCGHQRRARRAHPRARRRARSEENLRELRGARRRADRAQHPRRPVHRGAARGAHGRYRGGSRAQARRHAGRDRRGNRISDPR